MFSKIKAFFVAAEHDVEAIISSFTDTVAKLEAAAVAKGEEGFQHLQTSIQYEKLSDNAYEASEKAKSVAAKIKELVS